jgi:hypothetical protein
MGQPVDFAESETTVFDGRASEIACAFVACLPMSTRGIPSRSRRIQVPGGKGAMIVDNSTGEIKGLERPSP